MRVQIIVNSQGAIVGMAGAGEAAEMEVGLEAMPGQAVYEVEVPDNLLQAQSEDLLHQVAELDSVQQALGAVTIAGQGDVPLAGGMAGSPGGADVHRWSRGVQALAMNRSRLADKLGMRTDISQRNFPRPS